MADSAILNRLAATEFVNEEVAAEVYTLIHDQSVVDALAGHKPMKRATMRLRRQTASVDPAYVAEQGVKPKSRPSWDHETLTAETIASITPFTEEEIEDADIDSLAFVKTDTVERIVEVFDGYALGYDLSSPYAYSWSGNVPAGNTIAYDETNIGDLAEHVNQLMGKIEVVGYDCTGMAMHPRMKARLRGLRDSNGQPIYTENLRDNWTDYSVYGVPTKFTRQMAASGSPEVHEILAAYTPFMKVGDRLSVEIKLLDQATIEDPDNPGETINLAETDQIALRFRVRKAFGIIRDDILAKVTGV